ncbi:MAG: M14 family metallopeptidase [Patescibacteria group bacterium]
MKKIIIPLVVVIIIAAAAFYFFKGGSSSVNAPTDVPTNTTPATPVVVEDKTKTVIGKSVDGREIVAYHYGNVEGADTSASTMATSSTSSDADNVDLLFVGGIHGGYEWNTSLVAYELMSYLEKTPGIIPQNVRVTVIPVLNPDGLNEVLAVPFVPSTTGFKAADVSSSQEKQIAGRFNANEVDLNRNFDCDWQTEGKWQNKTVSGGSAAFSESESLAIKNYVEANEPDAVVVWYSAVGGVFASSCHNGVSTETRTLTNTFAKSSGYKAYESFNFYEITGDMVNWLAKKEIPAISVLLTNHTDTEWTKNKAGIEAVLKHYSK